MARPRAARRGRRAARARQRGARRARAAAGLLRGGLDPHEVAARRAPHRRARRARPQPQPVVRLARAGRGRAGPGRATVLHLHNYRLVCAVGTCFTRGADCTRCHGRDTRPGVRLNCRGTRAEAAVYGAALALWQRRLAAPPTRSSCRARSRAGGCARSARRSATRAASCRRCSAVRAGVDARRRPPRARRLAAGAGEGRRRRDRGVRAAGLPLVVAGDGPQAAALRARAAARAPTCASPAASTRRARRAAAGAAVAIVPSRSAETCGSPPPRRWPPACRWSPPAPAAWPGLCPGEGLSRPATPRRSPTACARCFGDGEAGERALRRRARARRRRRGGRARGRLRRLIAGSGTRAGTAAAPAGAPPGG